MAVKKIWFSFIAFLLAILTCFVFINGATVYNAASIINTNKKKIIIDAGHGGFDGGASVGNTLEKDINLVIAKNLKCLISMFGYDIIMIRETDCAINTEGNSIRTKKISDMKNRLQIMKNYPEAEFVSIHLNKYTTSKPNGLQVFYSPNDERSLTLSKNIQGAVKEILQNENHRKVKKATKDTYLLYNAPIPAVIIECGFLSNPQELENLTNSEYQQKLAFACFCGIVSNNNL